MISEQQIECSDSALVRTLHCKPLGYVFNSNSYMCLWNGSVGSRPLAVCPNFFMAEPHTAPFQWRRPITVLVWLPLPHNQALHHHPSLPASIPSYGNGITVFLNAITCKLLATFCKGSSTLFPTEKSLSDHLSWDIFFNSSETTLAWIVCRARWRCRFITRCQY